ncbi:MAG: ABC transporter substrate-binding protein [Planctomycetota bacterium]
MVKRIGLPCGLKSGLQMFCSAALLLVAVDSVRAIENFADLIGVTKVQDVKAGPIISVPYITWGGDVATFHANGGLETKAGSIYDQLGLKLKLVPGDDFPAQVRRYLNGESPFLRGTFQMLALASEALGRDPRTKGVVFLQLTWSAGDHMVGREQFKTLNDLKGKRIALQKNGPHIGMLDDILRSARLAWSDVRVVWVENLTGKGSPAELFRGDTSVDACMVISPDMAGLTGGLTSKGTGAEGTVKGAHVVVSTAEMSRSIPDVYLCRKDYYDAHPDHIEKFVAGYLQACEQVVALKKDFEAQRAAPKYLELLRLAQTIYGAEVLPTLEADAHGLIADATFVGLPGNRSFFLDKTNLEGFDAKSRKALDLAESQGYVKVRNAFFPPTLDYPKITQLGKLTHVEASRDGRVVAEKLDFNASELDENTLLSFTIGFEPDQATFSEEVYGAEFQRAVEQAALFGNAVVVVRGHADPTKTLSNFVKVGLQKGVLKRTGTSKADYKYFYDGRPLDLADTKTILKLIDSGAFDGATDDPRATAYAALNLSFKRSEAVRDAIVKYAKSKAVLLDASQIQPVGVGVTEPVISRPLNEQEAAANRRVEFRLIRVAAETLQKSDFDF